jgi:hypothetical protein
MQSGRGCEELEVQKILKSVASSRRNQDLPDAPVIKPIDTVICPEVKIESLEQMPDRVNNRSA